MIIDIKAKFSCDDCGTEFIVGIDPGFVPPDKCSAFFIAEEAIRAGYLGTYEDGHGETAGGLVDDMGRHYCFRCSQKH